MSILESHLVLGDGRFALLLVSAAVWKSLRSAIASSQRAAATFAQPEIALGVFAPVASIVLAPRIGQARPRTCV